MSFVVFVEFCATNWWNSVADSVHRARAEINRIATEILYTHASRFPFFFFFFVVVFPSFFFFFSFFREKKLPIKSLDITRSRPNIETRFFFLFFFLMETDRDDF